MYYSVIGHSTCLICFANEKFSPSADSYGPLYLSEMIVTVVFLSL